MSNFFLDLFGWLAGNIIKNLFIGAVGIAVGILISFVYFSWFILRFFNEECPSSLSRLHVTDPEGNVKEIIAPQTLSEGMSILISSVVSAATTKSGFTIKKSKKKNFVFFSIIFIVVFLSMVLFGFSTSIIHFSH
ncbi:hypothetical protein [Thermoactinomyces sp. DSM 45892]|uniref:hypothetical protein n=1 Tax=Thermoactinomyces sp. DSM 45892 TaxID=1882753 RepID=UPI0008953743|nr:hypothetical protein [Thermoactinomyces sp. DSM 45892]SDY99945.1 hypothetical protein SAMN05444416_11180 [Thermoactinomyces sp. DSM 45892]